VVTDLCFDLYTGQHLSRRPVLSRGRSRTSGEVSLPSVAASVSRYFSAGSRPTLAKYCRVRVAIALAFPGFAGRSQGLIATAS